MATAQDIIQDAFQRIGVYAAGEPITTADANRGLQVLNDMLDSWSNEQLFCYANLEQTITLVPGQSQYTMGPGGNGANVRPLSLRYGPGAAYVTDQNGDIYYVEVITQDVYNQIGYRLSTSNIPDTIFYNPQYPLGVITVFPVPSIGYSLSFDSFLQISDFAALSTAFGLPQGYRRAMVLSLGLELWPEYKAEGLEPTQLLLRAERDAKRAIKITNSKPITAVFDPAIVSRAQTSYNIYRGR